MNSKLFINKIRIAGLLSASFILFAFSKEKNNDLDFYRLKGKVKSIQEIRQTLDTSSGEARIISYNKTVRQFNTDGNITEVLVYGANNVLATKETDVYKKNGQKRVCYVRNFKKGSRVKQRVYLYDKNRKMMRLIYFGSAGLRTSVSDYDAQNNLCSVTHYFRHSGFMHKSDINYNYNYDSSGRLVMQYAINDEGRLVQKSIYKYDKKGNAIETDIYDTDTSIARRVNAQYDTLGNAVDISNAYFFRGGDLGQKSVDIYDDNGFKIEEDTYRIKPDNTMVLVRSIVYENDKVGNWVKETSFNNSKKGAVTTRLIEYY